MSQDEYTIKIMSRDQLDLAVGWAANEGWNPGLYDADCFYAADPSGFLIGVIGDEPVSTLSVVKYGKTYGFLGFYIVKPEHRGKGFGFQIWTQGLKYLAGRNIGLDGVVAQQSNYVKSGFKLAYRNIRYEGLSGGELSNNPDIVDISSLPFSMVETYDRSFFPDDRARFLKCWITQPESRTLGMMHHGRLEGYGMIRACRTGHKIGPLFADGPDQAESLLLSLRASVTPGLPVYLDVPEVNRKAVALAERFQMKVSFETARMYTGEFPRLPLNQVYGVTSFELG